MYDVNSSYRIWFPSTVFRISLWSVFSCLAPCSCSTPKISNPFFLNTSVVLSLFFNTHKGSLDQSMGHQFVLAHILRLRPLQFCDVSQVNCLTFKFPTTNIFLLLLCVTFSKSSSSPFGVSFADIYNALIVVSPTIIAMPWNIVWHVLMITHYSILAFIHKANPLNSWACCVSMLFLLLCKHMAWDSAPLCRIHVSRVSVISALPVSRSMKRVLTSKFSYIYCNYTCCPFNHHRIGHHSRLIISFARFSSVPLILDIGQDSDLLLRSHPFFDFGSVFPVSNAR